MLPPGTGARLAYVVDPQGRVFHIDHGGADPSLLGPNGVLSELQNRAFAARGREVAEHGDFSELLEFGLEAGMFTFAGSRQFATIAHAPAGGRTGGGRSDGGRSGGAGAGRSRSNMPEDFPRNTRVEDPLTREEFENLPEQGMIDPTRIRTIQDTVTYRFSDGRTLEDTRRSFAEGESERIPPVRIFERDGKIWTLDHRRLVAARLAGTELRYVKVSLGEVNQEWVRKHSTLNDGQEIRIVNVRPKRKRR